MFRIYIYIYTYVYILNIKKLTFKIDVYLCRDIGPKSSLSIYILGPRPKLRTRGFSRRINLCQKRPC